MKDILIGLLSKAYNLDTERIAELLYKKADDGTLTEEVAEDALQALIDIDVQRAAKLKEDAKKRFDDGHKKGTSETASKWEKMLREKFAVDGEGDSILEALEEKLKGKADMPEDAVKRHKLYRDLELAAQQREEAARNEGLQALEAYKAETSKAQRRSQAEARAKEILLNQKPVLEDDQTIADTRIRDFLRDLGEFDFDENLNPLKDGESYKNEHGHLVTFDDLAKQIASRRFKFQVSDPKGNGGNKNEPGAGGSGGRQPIATPKNETELWEAYRNAVPEDRKAIMDAYEKEHGAIQV